MCCVACLLRPVNCSLGVLFVALCPVGVARCVLLVVRRWLSVVGRVGCMSLFVV